MLAVQGRSNFQTALEQLREMIFMGDLAAGSDHLETELAEKLGMSRTPVREALLTLEGQGLLQVRPRRGVRILPISPDDMAEIYDVLTELESMAARNAARAGYSDEALSELASMVTQMDCALKKGDLYSWAFADDRFHHELVRLGGNSRAMLIVERMQDQVRRARLATLFMRTLPVSSNKDHEAVFAAIKAGDEKRAHAQHWMHREKAKRTLIALLKRHRLKGL